MLDNLIFKKWYLLLCFSFIRYRRRHVVARTVIVTILMLLKASSFFLLLRPTKVCLFVGTAIIGMCTSAVSSILASMETKLFGDNLTLPQMIVIANITIIGSLLFGDIVAVIMIKKWKKDITCSSDLIVIRECSSHGFVFVTWEPY